MRMEIETLYETYGPMVLRRCQRLLRDDEHALDAMHDVFVQMLRRRERLEVRAPAALLLCTATNVCLNRLRRERRHPADSGEELLLAIADQTEPTPESQALARRILHRLWGTTSASTQLMAVLHFVDGLTLAEVAEELGLSEAGVRKRLRTYRQSLAPLAKGEE